ncbi:cytochrome ubiquinol oxidase subunit I [Propionibacterium australiense]|uniref:Cytochrome bd terminal oxidase subunit I n=1 Tax=Propionibacterium australiense TaxID=119981 RepID=A0A383S9J9_9ACTN|nr:cytochrome ubiquinol oxidase subunit I [Propionibacterium australiense]RLP07491.1 cytochrome ubiquinol oxidase subunit I [Propionibacterium australiense]SYZ34094.1 Cytochrome bd terminal oxidase subunit I [Propionibacterium australiense]VEH88683.1 Cytochrome d ubiquinol oxidase subunit 1 [Propionibacterium australiense]
MDAEVLSRWQFGITTVYHFLFVPITIGITWLMAGMQTAWMRTRDDQWLRLVKFFAKLMLINFAAGVVTGIVQEFQFGMNWSEYSRFVGDIFGAPLALEALIAFFMESTFIGLWIFGWNRLPRMLHLACIYLVAIGTTASAAFILAANCWMQNPVGAVYNETAGRAELSSFTDVLTNPFFLATFPHQMGASLMVAGALLLGVSGWWLAARRREALAGTGGEDDIDTWRKSARLGAWVLLFAGAATLVSGDLQAQVETQYQPMKLAASEGLVETEDGAPFSLVAIITKEGEGAETTYHKVLSIEVPYVLSLLAQHDPNATVQGIQDLRQQYLDEGYRSNDGEVNQLQEAFAAELRDMPVDPVPDVMVSFYSFRLMIGLGCLAIGIGAVMLWLTRAGRVPGGGRLYTAIMVCLPFLPLLANSFGWIFTEMGRQPWIVYGVLPTAAGVSPGNTALDVLLTMVLYTLIYAAVAVVVLKLFIRTIREGLPELVAPAASGTDRPMTFAY